MKSSLKDNNPFVSFWIVTAYPFNISNAVLECLEFLLLLSLCLALYTLFACFFLLATLIQLPLTGPVCPFRCLVRVVA